MLIEIDKLVTISMLNADGWPLPPKICQRYTMSSSASECVLCL